MEPILQALLTEGQAECTCQCQKLPFVFFNTKIECKACWFSSTAGNIGGPFNLLSELKKAKTDTPQIVVCPDISPKQEQIYEAVGLIVNLARVQHALSRLLGDKFTDENDSIIPSYDLFEFLVFRNKDSVGAVIAREMLRQWGVTFQITARAASELFVRRPELGRGLCVILGDIHVKLENQRRGVASSAGPVTISQLYFSFMWQPQTWPVRFALVACNASAATSLAGNKDVLIDKKPIGVKDRLDLALSTIVTFPWEPISRACAQFAASSVGDQSSTPLVEEATLEGVAAGLRDDLVSGFAVRRVLSLKGKSSQETANANMVVERTGRPLLFFANCKSVAEALLDNGADPLAKDDQGRTAMEVVRSPGVIEALTTALQSKGGNLGRLADLSATSDRGAAVLHSSVRDGNGALLRRLVEEANVDINLTVGDLPCVIFAQDVETLRTCVALGADLSRKWTTEGLSILHLAARLNKSEAFFKVCLEELKKATPEDATIDLLSEPAGMTALMNARSIPTVETLLTLGANPLAVDHEGAPVASCLLAASMEAEPLLHLLAAAAVAQKRTGDDGEILATVEDALKTIVNQSNGDGQNAIYACGSSRQLKAVLEAGAVVKPFGAYLISPLSFFTFNNNGPCVAELLRTIGDRDGHASMQALLDHRDTLGKTALMYAKTPVVARLLQMQGANVNARCSEGLSVLGHMLAAGIHDSDFDEATLVSLFATQAIGTAQGAGASSNAPPAPSVMVHSPNWENLELSPPLTAAVAESIAAAERARIVAEIEASETLSAEEKSVRLSAVPSVEQVVTSSLEADKTSVWRGNSLGLSETMLVSSASQVALLARVGFAFHLDRSLTGATPLMAALSTGAATPAVREMVNTMALDRADMLRLPPQQRRSLGVVGGGDQLVVSHLNEVRTGPPRSSKGFSLLNWEYLPLVNLFNPIPAWRGSSWMFSQLPVHAAVRGMTAVMWCRAPVDLATLHMLGADLMAVTDEDTKLTLFHFLAANGGPTLMREALRCLLAQCATMHSEGKGGEPASTAKAFLSRADARGFTALDIAEAVDNAEVAELLKKMGVPNGVAFKQPAA